MVTAALIPSLCIHISSPFFSNAALVMLVKLLVVLVLLVPLVVLAVLLVLSGSILDLVWLMNVYATRSVIFHPDAAIRIRVDMSLICLITAN